MTELNRTDNQVLPKLFELPDATLRWWPGVFAGAHSDELMRHLDLLPWQKPSIRMFGRMVPIPRQQIWIGDAHCSYRYSGVLFQPLPWTSPLQAVANQIAQLTGARFNCVLLNRYQNGAEHMGWHSDDEPELGHNPIIASVSFGQLRRFDIRHKDLGCHLQFNLGHGDLLLMAGDCQQYWQHALPKQSKAAGTRYNLTFRYIAEQRSS